MANHGTHTKTAKQRAQHKAKPSRQKRLERRDDARRAEFRTYLATRDYAFRVGPFVSLVWPHRNDVERVFRIAEYLATRAERPTAKRAA